MASLCGHSRAEGDFVSDVHVFQCPLTGQTSDFKCFFFPATRTPSHYYVKLIACHQLVVH